MQKVTIKIAVIFIITSLFSACGGNQEEPIEEIIEETTKTTDTDQVDYMLPSSLQIAELFKNAGLSYIGNVTSPKEKVETFNSKNIQKLNFGVYSADMAYCIINNQPQESINYLNSLRKLSEKLWMTDILNSMGVSTRLEANIGNKDSLTYIMSELQMQLDDYLEENEMSNTGAVIFAGAWIETMYLGAKVNESKQNDKLISILSEQAAILNSLIKSVKQSDEDNEFTELITDLENIQKHFSRFDEESSEDYVLTKEEVSTLSADITALRTKIIGDKK